MAETAGVRATIKTFDSGAGSVGNRSSTKDATAGYVNTTGSPFAGVTGKFDTGVTICSSQSLVEDLFSKADKLMDTSKSRQYCDQADRSSDISVMSKYINKSSQDSKQKLDSRVEAIIKRYSDPLMSLGESPRTKRYPMYSIKTSPTSFTPSFPEGCVTRGNMGGIGGYCGTVLNRDSPDFHRMSAGSDKFETLPIGDAEQEEVLSRRSGEQTPEVKDCHFRTKCEDADTSPRVKSEAYDGRNRAKSEAYEARNRGKSEAYDARARGKSEAYEKRTRAKSEANTAPQSRGKMESFDGPPRGKSEASTIEKKMGNKAKTSTGSAGSTGGGGGCSKMVCPPCNQIKKTPSQKSIKAARPSTNKSGNKSMTDKTNNGGCPCAANPPVISGGSKDGRGDAAQRSPRQFPNGCCQPPDPPCKPRCCPPPDPPCKPRCCPPPDPCPPRCCPPPDPCLPRCCPPPDPCPPRCCPPPDPCAPRCCPPPDPCATKNKKIKGNNKLKKGSKSRHALVEEAKRVYGENQLLKLEGMELRKEMECTRKGLMMECAKVLHSVLSFCEERSKKEKAVIRSEDRDKLCTALQ